MRRIAVFVAGLLAIGAASFAQAGVPYQTALDAAIADVNARLGTNLSWSAGQIAYQYSESRVTGDNLGCPNVAATNQNPYLQMTTRFDLNFDGVYEWEHRFAYEADGTLRMVVCRAPDPQDVQATSPAPAASPTPSVTTVTPLDTPSAEPIFGRDGPRVFPMTVCGGLETRLVNGGTGRVAPDGAPNNLRQSQVLTALKIGELPAGTAFTVMDGPFCNENIAWYLVGDGTRPLGWTAEGNNGDYFLEPLITDAEPITPDDIARLQAVGGTFAPGARIISANGPDGVLIGSDSGTQLWQPLGGFTPLSTLTWDAALEFPTPHGWLFVDNTGRQWAADIANSGMFTLATLSGTEHIPFTAQTMMQVPVVAVDNESNFAAAVVSDSSTVSLIQLGRNGMPNEVLMSLAQSRTVRDLAFSADGMRLYVLTDTQLVTYWFIRGEGWSGQPQQVVNVDVVGGALAVDEGGDRVAVTGTLASGASGIRVFNGLNSELTGDETSVNFDAPAGIALSVPSFNANGSLVAAYASQSSVALMDTTTGAVSFLPVAGTPGEVGAVAFSRDGLVLWVLNGATGVQTFAATVE